MTGSTVPAAMVPAAMVPAAMVRAAMVPAAMVPAATVPVATADAGRPTDAVGGATALTMRRVTARRRGLTLIDGLDLEVEPGTILAVQGPSGAGKTTLLRILAGLLAPDGGTVQRPPGRLGMVFQDPRLLPWRSALENVAVVVDGDRQDRLRRAAAWLERLHLGDAMALRPHRLSGGMRQRVSIARALVVEPTLVLVDEPFSALDRELARALRSKLSNLLRAQGCVTVWVTHDPEEAAVVADQRLLLGGPSHGEWHLATAPQP